jgi:hypothetical protein
MATSFPANLDVLVNPQPLDSVEVVPHAKQHADANDAIEALEQKVGADNSSNPNSLDYKVRSLENNFFMEKSRIGNIKNFHSFYNLCIFWYESNRQLLE